MLVELKLRPLILTPLREPSGSGLRASKSEDSTFSCGGVLILEYHTLRVALSSICDPGGSERR